MVLLRISTRSSVRLMVRRASKYDHYPNLTYTCAHQMYSSQDLALEARDIWLEWNRAIKESRPNDLPRPLTPEDELLTVCGVYHMADGAELCDLYKKNLQVMSDTAPSFRDLQFIKVFWEFSRVKFYSTVQSLTINICRAARRMQSGPNPWARSGKRSITSSTSFEMAK